MWRYGVLLFQLIVGRTLFHIDEQENCVSDEVLESIANWSGSSINVKLEAVQKKWPQEMLQLLKQLLHPEPNKRLKDWRIIEDLIKG